MVGLKLTLRIIRLVGGNKKVTLSDISRWLDITYSHAHRSVDELEDNGFLITLKNGRVRIVELDDKGKILYKRLDPFLKVIDSVEFTKY